MKWSLNRALNELRDVLGEGMPSDLPPMDGGKMSDWFVWAKKTVPNAQDEAAKASIPAHYQKTCSLDAFQKNVRYFYHKKGYPTEQAVAAAYSALRTACGVPSDAPEMTPSEIVKKGK